VSTITRLEALRIPVNFRGDWLLLRIHTDAAIVGLGDGSHGHDDEWIWRAWQEELAPRLIGKDAAEMEARLAELREWASGDSNSRRAVTAISAVEHALWDIQGQRTGRPIHALLAEAAGYPPAHPTRTEIALYANINRGTVDRSPQGFAARAQEAVEAGFDALKCAPFDEVTRGLSTRERIEAAQTGGERVRAMRAAVGDGVVILVDCHGRFDVESAVAVAGLLEAPRAGWFEAPTAGLRPEDLAAVRARIPMPLATGETLYGLEAFAEVLDAGGADVLMPDVKQSGGLRACLAVAELCAARGVAFSPHNPAGPVATALSLHLCAVAPAFTRLEYQFHELAGSGDLITPPERVEAGDLSVPPAPGLGVRWRGD
jgi:galactonate dehydratase